MLFHLLLLTTYRTSWQRTSYSGVKDRFRANLAKSIYLFFLLQNVFLCAAKLANI